MKNVGVDIKDDVNNNKEILKDVSLEFEAGKIYVITGPNGGGKSTLAKCIMGIMPQNTGKIYLDGEDISDLSIVERSKKGIGYAFQTPAKFKGLKVGNLLKLAKGDSENSIEQTLRNVGLNPEEYLNRSIDNSFSGGELKRIELASILIQDLKLALFDEPEAGIDLWSFKLLIKTFKRLNRFTDTCIVIISHQERIMEMANEIVVIDKGEVAQKTVKNKLLSILNSNDLDNCELTCCERGELCGE
ncbi:MAG: ATP-binding cassette domain-containing protein [Peptostreptococcaceae bacterium]|nr:ATP-binding cassette domain-containing protein [Peptostreptococcaceae bacterium]